MPDEPHQLLTPDECLRKAKECREQADKPAAYRVVLLARAEEWDRWAKIRPR